MPARILDHVHWHPDPEAEARGEPGLFHSYIRSLAAVLHHLGDDVDPTWLMGSSGFAFRIWVNQVMCPSATSVFDWSAILPEAVEQAGRRCAHVSRYWHEGSLRQARRDQARQLIAAAIDRGVPAICWDLPPVPEWSLVVGYDDGERLYRTLGVDGQPYTLPYDQLGDRDIPILSATIVGEPNLRDRADVVRRSLQVAVDHAAQKEWMDRPKYMDGPPAFDLWAGLVEPGPHQAESFQFARYCAGHWYGARAYAARYVDAVAGGSGALRDAATAYAEVAALLRPVWQAFAGDVRPDDNALTALGRSLRAAGQADRRAVDGLARYLQEG